MTAMSVVIATDHDGASSIVRRCLHMVPGILAQAGFSVRTHLGRHNPVGPEHTYLVGLDAEIGGDSLVFGIFGAHGSPAGVVDRNGNILLTVEQCKFFEKAVLLMFSCLGSSTFPTDACELEGGAHVSAVVFYDPELVILPRNHGGDPNAKRLKEDERLVLQNILETHVRCLCDGDSVKQMMERCRSEWNDAVRNMPNGRVHVGMTWVYNRRRLACRGDADATVA